MSPLHPLQQEEVEDVPLREDGNEKNVTTNIHSMGSTNHSIKSMRENDFHRQRDNSNQSDDDDDEDVKLLSSSVSKSRHSTTTRQGFWERFVNVFSSSSSSVRRTTTFKDKPASSQHHPQQQQVTSNCVKSCLYQDDDNDNDNKQHSEALLLSSKTFPQVYPQRWIQLFYLSILALISDWVCFSLAAAPQAFEAHYQHASSDLIDMFLFTNVATSFIVTDVVARFGMKKTLRGAALVMTIGCWFRSGILFWWPQQQDNHESSLLRVMPSYWSIVLGTLLVGAAQPFFQCTPPLLSAQWFASHERATSTAVAINFNQIGIATAFCLGGTMASGSVRGVLHYFGLISCCCTAALVGVYFQFQDLPPTPPSTSELEKVLQNKKEPPFMVSVKKCFSTPGFTKALTAFVCSITITNIVGAFIDEVMERGGITNKFHIALAGSAFEIAIVLGGIIIGGYVDRTKRYKRVTLVCLTLSLLFLIPLGLTEHALGKEPILLVTSLVGLGLVAGPIQPINAELAVDVTYPGDETAVESIQQIGGNLISALLVPCAKRASRADYQLLSKIPLLASDIRGDVVLLLAITVVTYAYFMGFYAPLRRTIADRNDSDARDGMELRPIHSQHDQDEEEEEGGEMGKLLIV